MSDPVRGLSLSSHPASESPPGVPHHPRPLLPRHGAVQVAAALQAAGELLEVGVEAHGGPGDREGHLADVDVGGQELRGRTQHCRRRLRRVPGGTWGLAVVINMVGPVLSVITES